MAHWARDAGYGATILGVRLITDEPQLRSVDAALAAGVVIAAGSAAVDHVTGFRCPLYALTGCWCAFCGATRAVVALVERHPETALRDNGLVMLILLFVVVRFVFRFAGARTLVASADAWIERVDMRVWMAVLLVWTVVRNLPWFSFLGPVQ